MLSSASGRQESLIDDGVLSTIHKNLSLLLQFITACVLLYVHPLCSAHSLILQESTLFYLFGWRISLEQAICGTGGLERRGCLYGPVGRSIVANYRRYQFRPLFDRLQDLRRSGQVSFFADVLELA